jgi:hypothetical protein
MIFFNPPIALVLLAFSLVLLIYFIWDRWKKTT